MDTRLKCPAPYNLPHVANDPLHAVLRGRGDG